MSELKDCPFCGNRPSIVYGRTKYGKMVRIACHGPECDISPSTSWFPTEEFASIRWNMRDGVADKKCITCRRWEHITGVCLNRGSEHHYDFMRSVDSCEKWEQSENVFE